MRVVVVDDECDYQYGEDDTDGVGMGHGDIIACKAGFTYELCPTESLVEFLPEHFPTFTVQAIFYVFFWFL